MTDHLTEDQRQGAADGSLAAADLALAETHMRVCESCAVDVRRLARLHADLRHAGDDAVSADDLWPDILVRVEQRKVIAMPGAGAHTPDKRTGRRHWIVPSVAAAAVIAATVFTVRSRNAGPSSDTSFDGATVTTVAESTQAYQQEAQALLNRLELQRAMLRPETAASIDQSLRVIDGAIAELQEAVTRDPNNSALRRLLASSFRQKVDLLKRVSNAS